MKITEDMIESTKIENVTKSDSEEITNEIEQELRKLEFVYHKHTLQGKEPHWDLRIKLFDRLLEFKLWRNILEENSSLVVIQFCYDMSWFIKKGTLDKDFGELQSRVECLDSGTVGIIENYLSYKKFVFDGSKLNGEFILRKEENRWVFERPRNLTIELTELEYVYHLHEIDGEEPHYDVRLKLSPERILEFRLDEDVSETGKSLATPDAYDDISWFMHRGQRSLKNIGNIKSYTTVIDYGNVDTLKSAPNLKSFNFKSTGIYDGHRLKGHYELTKKGNRWYFQKSE